MRETEIETEITEKEVERVYCDECGDECTEDHQIKASEVCQSCAEGWITYETVERALSSVEFDNNNDITVGAAIVGVVILPITVSLVVTNSFDPTRNDRLSIYMFAFGGAAWGALILLLLLVAI